MMKHVIASVILWWIANTITSLASKDVMKGDDVQGNRSMESTVAFRDLRWVDLTALQHLLGMAVSVCWLKMVAKMPVWPTITRRKAVFSAAFGNLLGNLATNAAYALITSSTTQVVKACEPLFTIFFAAVFSVSYKGLELSTLLSVVIIVLSASTFISEDATLNISGLVAGMVSNMGFATRNIHLSNLSDRWDNPVQKLALVSTFSLLLLLPVLLVKVILHCELTLSTITRSESLVSGVFHSIYNLASITVLQSFSPLTHAVLNISKRIIVVSVNIAYFSIPVTGNMLVGLGVLVFGLYLYHRASAHKSKWNLLKLLLLSGFLGYLLTQMQCISQSKSLKDSSGSPTHSYTRIITAWVSGRQIFESVVTNIGKMAENNPKIPVKVYCGTSQCIYTVTELAKPNIMVDFLRVNEVVKDTLLEAWVARHAMNKLLAGIKFEDHLQEVVTLGLLWSIGGLYINPTIQINYSSLPLGNNAWVSMQTRVSKSTSMPKFFDAAYFPRYHSFIKKLMELYVQKYPTEIKKSVFPFDFQETLLDVFNSTCTDCPSLLEDIQLRRVTATNQTLHFGTLSYDTRVAYHGTANLGDEMQGFPGIQFLPFVDSFLERDNLGASKGAGNVTVFLNAWWGSGNASWPPPSNVNPIMLSIHIAEDMQRVWKKHLSYLKNKTPIGCRDYSTLQFLRGLGVSAYFSGCLTLLVSNPNMRGNRTDNIYIVDVWDRFVRLFPPEIQKKAIRWSHSWEKEQALASDTLGRFAGAYKLMEMYGRAKLVITQRIHCALPCVAMGTPVIFINSNAMPGGGGTKHTSSPRVAGLTPLFHTLDVYTTSTNDIVKWTHDFPWHNIPPNPNLSMTMRLRATAWNVIRKNQVLYDAAKKFGVLPLKLPIQAPTIGDLIFHLIITNASTMKGLHAQSGRLKWRQRRSIESILYHHPTAMVIIHSNTLRLGELDVFTEAGYSITVLRYNLTELLQQSPASSFTVRLKETTKPWYSHDNLLKLLILHQWGGVYVDTDVIMVRPLDSRLKNALTWSDSSNTSLHGAFMAFEKGSWFLEKCLIELTKSYDPQTWSDDAALFLTERSIGRDDLTILPYYAFQSIPRNQLLTKCFTDTSGVDFESYKDTLHAKAYGLFLDSKLTGNEGLETKLKEGTICSHLLNSYCIFCNEMH